MNPLSPYIFVFCLNCLSILFDDVISQHLFFPSEFGSHSFNSCLFFVDNIFLFSRATDSDCQKIMPLVSKFFAFFAQLISLSKSKIILLQKYPHWQEPYNSMDTFQYSNRDIQDSIPSSNYRNIHTHTHTHTQIHHLINDLQKSVQIHSYPSLGFYLGASLPTEYHVKPSNFC